MLSWLWRLFGRRHSLDLYHPSERLIYTYFDGEKMVRADPLRLERRLAAVSPELSTDIKVSRSLSKDAAKAHEELLAKIREVFGVKPLEEGGLTEIETVRLLEHYLTFTDGVKKNSRPLATLPTETSAPSEVSSGESPATPSSSGSGSTASGNPTEKPGPSPKGPPSPGA